MENYQNNPPNLNNQREIAGRNNGEAKNRNRFFNNPYSICHLNSQETLEKIYLHEVAVIGEKETIRKSNAR